MNEEFRKITFMDDLIAAANKPFLQGKARRLVALEWILRWKYTTQRILKDLFDTSQPSISRTLKQLEKEKLITVVPIPHVLVKKIIFITAKGEKLIKSKTGQEYLRRTTPRAFNPDGIIHDLFCQHSFIHKARECFEFISEPETKAMCSDRLRRADILFKDSDGEITAVEAELSRKNTLSRDQMISTLASDMRNGKIHTVFFICGPKSGVASGLTISLNNVQLPEFRRHNETGKLVSKNDIWVNLSDLRENSFIVDDDDYLNGCYYIDEKRDATG